MNHNTIGSRAAISVAVALALAACGGGGSGSTADNSAPSSTVVSGTAAVGAPLVGTVTVKDALGAIKGPIAIGANGAYSVDVTGMTAPFVFRASGTANGETYTVHSIATAADANGNINITQLTDLVVANIAGQLAQNYFDNFGPSGHADAATKAAVDAEVSKLKEKLLPVLTALGVDASIDLLRAKFTPLSSALDKALDVINVSVDSTTNIATISTLVNTITITDDLAKKAADEAAPPTLSADNVATADGDRDLVKKAVTDFGAKFATGLPLASQLTPLITTGFLHNDANGTAFTNDISSQASLVGASFTDIDIQNIDYSDPTKITARVSFSIKNSNGVELDRVPNMRVRKSSVDGIWRLHGNQRALDLSGYAAMIKNVSTDTCVMTGLQFGIQDQNAGNNGGTIAYILVTGPGLPLAGLRYDAAALGGKWKISGASTPYYMMANSCSGTQTVSDANIAAIPDNAIYTLTAYTAANAAITFPSGTADGKYTIKIPRRPLTLAEAKANDVFPVIGSPSFADFSNYSSGALAITASNVYPLRVGEIYLAQNTTTADFREARADVVPASGGTLSGSLSLTAAGSGTINWRTVYAESRDAYRRRLSATYSIGTPP
jgi:hypothetical protein